MTRQESIALCGRAATDDDAFAAIYARYRPYLLGGARRLVRCREDAEDLVQDLFVAIRPRLGQFGGRADLGTWLSQALYRLHFSRCRRKQEPEAVSTSAAPPNQTLAWHSLASAARRLNPAERRVARSLLLGETAQEFAEAAGLTPNAVRVSRFRVRRKLAEALEIA